MLSGLRAELRGLLDLLLPAACPLCGGSPEQGATEVLCAACLDGIHPPDSACCPRCALPYPLPFGHDHLCEDCLRHEPPFLWTRCLGWYEGTLRQAVQRFKYHGAVHLDRPLGRLLATSLEQARTSFRPDLLIAVPLCRQRLRERTYNQSLLLARELGRHWRLPAPSRQLRRVRPTPPQQGLTARERRRNLKGAFALAEPLDGERVLLVDDVMTTGATARECGATLLAGGASAVAVAVLARTGQWRLDFDG